MTRTITTLALLTALAFAPLSTAAAQGRGASASQTSSLEIPVVGQVSGGGSFAGTLQLNNFVSQNGTLAVAGTLTGLLTDATGTVTSIVANVTGEADVQQATCEILFVHIGPITVRLLGLEIELNQTILNVTAQRDGLLGNLLCPIATADPAALTNLLNQVLAVLN